MGVGSVEGKAECFEGFAEFVVWEGGFEVVSCVLGGTVGYSFGEVNELVGEGVELGTVFVSVNERLDGNVGGGDGKVVDVYGGENIGDGVEAFE